MNPIEKIKGLKAGCLIPLILIVLPTVVMMIYAAIDGVTDIIYENKMHKLVEAGDFVEARKAAYHLDEGSPRNDAIEEITRAEISSLVRLGEYTRAQSVASEFQHNNIYLEIVTNKIPQFIEEGKIEDVYNILTTWTFQNVPIYTAECQRGSINEKNKKYNAEIAAFNNNVFKIFNIALADKNIEFLRKLIILFKEEMIVESSTLIKEDEEHHSHLDYMNVKYKKENNALREAQQKLATAKIKL